MSNTLNLGNGDWATKENSLLGYNSENGNYKPLPFDFTRASNATFVNKSGLIETAANGVPRIDFLGNTKGALLLEPQRSNLITYSSDLSNAAWGNYNFSGANMTEQFGVLSPDGSNNATRLTYTNTSIGSGGSLLTSNITLVANAQYTISFYAKHVSGTKQIRVDLRNTSSGGVSGAPFTLTNEWKRYTKTVTNDSETNRGVQFRILESEFQGDRTFDVWGMQLEQASHSTSTIPTSGSAVTRLADDCSQTPPDGVINSSEGVLYADFEISDLNTSTSYPISIYGIGATIQIYYRAATQSISFLSSVGGIQYLYHSNINPLGRHKVALVYKNNQYSSFADGVLLDRQNSGNVPSPNTLNVLGLKDSGSSYFRGKVKDVKLYNTALTDQELIALTTI